MSVVSTELAGQDTSEAMLLAATRAVTDAHSPPAVKAVGVTVSYRGRSVLENVSLSLGAGRITAIVGPSGCGKTTLLSCFNRMTDLIRGCHVSGQIEIAGQSIFAPGADVSLLRRRVGMIFQRPTPLPMSIGQNVEFPLKMHTPLGAKARAEIAEQALRDVGLWEEVSDRLDDPATTLSGGQQQRLCIARALVLRPSVLLFDEPCSALDPVAMATCEALIKGLRGRYTIAIVTHNLAQARRLADDAAVLWCCGGAGPLVESGAACQIFDAPQTSLTASYVSGRCG